MEKKELCVVLDGFSRGAVSADLLRDVLSNEEDLLIKLKQVLCPETSYPDFDDALIAMEIAWDLCTVFSKKQELLEKRGHEQSDATAGEIDGAKLGELAIPTLWEGAVSCQIAGLNPARILWDAVEKRRGEAEEEGKADD